MTIVRPVFVVRLLLLLLAALATTAVSGFSVWADEEAEVPPPAPALPLDVEVPAVEPSDAAAEAEAEPLEIDNEHAAFYVHAEVDRASRQYQEGQSLRLRVRCEVDAYLYVLYRDASGDIYQIFPNSGQRQNRVAANQDTMIPGDDDLFRWVVGAPFGQETIRVIASKEPLEPLAEPKLMAGRFNSVPAKTLAAARKELGAKQNDTWAAVDLQIETLPRDASAGAPGGRRWGLFMGTSKFRYHDLISRLTDGKGGLNLRGCHKDAIDTAELFKKVGQMDGVRLLIDEQATRAKIAEAITEWLPSVSRPGDTIFISYSGHGGQIPDDNGDEEDGQDEYITTYDVMNSLVLGHLLDHRDQIPADELQRVAGLVDVIRKVGLERADETIARYTGISDDTFGHWLQKLAGRQVIVLLDTCHSGGFATEEKSLAPVAEAPPFDFLDGELTRLKDIGQPEQAIITASKAWQIAYELPSGDNSMLTTAFMLSMENLQRPVRLEAAFEYTEAAMTELFRLWNEANAEAGRDPVEPHQPHMRNYCTRPVIVKP